MDDDTLRVTVDGSNPHLPPVMVLLGRGCRWAAAGIAALRVCSGG